ncbi:hypothetical protein B296_00016221 [Ensete ventricosum]|uniref:Uncharacterized protein n=1 Tax=Ensete ventricosum TaxID=4639 RepID=A0A427AFF1_ENSVE|nr:hypothetical protein B296_00016221 [Ensete ventricosum]
MDREAGIEMRPRIYEKKKKKKKKRSESEPMGERETVVNSKGSRKGTENERVSEQERVRKREWRARIR